MNTIDTADTAVLLGPESDDEAEALKAVLSAFNQTEALLGYYHNRPGESDEHTPVALSQRNDRDGCGGGCGGCGEDLPSGGLSDLFWWALGVLADLTFYFLVGMGIGALIELGPRAAVEALSDLVAL